jgi:rubrerythrin
MDSPKVLELKAQAEILREAIGRVKASHDFYVAASRSTKKKYEKDIHDQLALEEMVHRDDLSRQLEEVEAQIEMESALAEGSGKDEERP